MSYFVVVMLVLAVAALIAAPLLSLESAPVDPGADVQRERLEREKAAALLAIREAQLDKAMGKLSDDDYASLRDFYERRALAAMAGLGDDLDGDSDDTVEPKR